MSILLKDVLVLTTRLTCTDSTHFSSDKDEVRREGLLSVQSDVTAHDCSAVVSSSPGEVAPRKDRAVRPGWGGDTPT